MRIPIRCLAVGLTLCVAAWGSRLDAAAGTSTVATSGQPAYIAPGWPDGVDAVVNDPARTTGWNDWFSGWPSDVNHYGYQIGDMADLNRLVRALAAVQPGLRQIRLAPMQEPKGLGWVTSLPAGNDVPVMFSIGNQKTLDTWFQRQPGGTLGKLQFEATPVAVPPTLTIFVLNKAVDLQQLDIPDGINVSQGDCPRRFHLSNIVRENEPPQQRAQPKPVSEAQQLAIDQIEAFLKTEKVARDATDLGKLQGDWEIVECNRNGAAYPDELGGQTTFDGDTAIVRTTDGDRTDYRISLQPEESPKTIDWTMVHSGRRYVLHSIYELEGETLRFCSPAAFEAPSPPELATNPGDGRWLFVLKRRR